MKVEINLNAPKVDTPKVETPKVAASKANAVDAPKVDEVDAPKVHAPEVDAPKVEQAEDVKAEAVEEADEPAVDMTTSVEEPKVEWAEEVEAVETAKADEAGNTSEPVEATPKENNEEDGWTVVQRKPKPVKPEGPARRQTPFNTTIKSVNGRTLVPLAPKPPFEPTGPPPRFDRRTAGSRLARLGWRKLADEDRPAMRTTLKKGFKIHAQRGIWYLEGDRLFMIESAERDNHGKMYITDYGYNFIFLFAAELCDAVDRLVEDSMVEGGGKLARSGPVRAWGKKYEEGAEDEVGKFEMLGSWVGEIVKA
ncbi:hypothetical protein BJ508DRAFT_313172 [Ascobolus immersus RN42]|uniref:Uncharacterized protein n=1 Tax=Ascobolus immersus RN42 TaxID=1160509 RepID=A0A3N4HJZ0_ASCIM|nr:hypothetical protein BJ508DRAFT_313172 [Ascobolus immersus RN42]